MKQCKLFIAILLAALCLLACAAADEPTVYQRGNFKFILLEDGTAEITGYTGNSANLVVPDTLDGYKVTGIGDDAFYSCDSLTSITIPDSVTQMGANPFRFCEKLTSIRVSPGHPTLATIDGVLFDKAEKKLICYPYEFTASSYAVPNGIRSIGKWAFCDCDSLTSITLPDGLTSIGEGAFSNCDSLTSITIPDSVTQMGANPFRSCKKLTSIRVSPSHPTLVTIDGVLFDKAEKKLICYPYAFTASSYAVPNGILSIGDGAFICSSLTSITLPDSVTSIGDGAFHFCTSLTSITLPDGVTSIGDSAFRYCKSLTSITIPASVTNIGDSAFADCSDTLLFTVEQGSYADQWCKENNLYFTYPNANDWLLN